MAELDTIAIYNPLKEDFIGTFNGESYKMGAEAEKSYPTFLAFHMAKGLSDKILSVEIADIKKQAIKEKMPQSPKNAQLMIYDNPKRRIALYDILRSKELVQGCISVFPFKGFIGEMSDYDAYVEKKEKKSEKTEKVSA